MLSVSRPEFGFRVRRGLACLSLALIVFAGACGGPTSQSGAGVDPTTGEPVAAVPIPKDVEQAYATVRAFRFEPYSGVQRGALGTAEARGGNAADQALTLHAALVKMGHTARIARGTLDDAALATLLASLTPAGATAPKATGEPPPLFAAMQDKQLTTAARAHHWVEVQHGGKWVALDPSFRTSVSGQAFAAADSHVDDPATLERQRVTLALKQVAKGKEQDLGRIETTTEALRNRRVSLVMAGSPKVAGGKPSGGNPMGGGGLMGGGLAGALTGKPKPKPKPKPKAKAGEIESIAYTHELVIDGKTQPMKGASWKAQGDIERQWLEITVTAPGQPPVVVAQPLFDREGKEAPPLVRRLEYAWVAGPLHRAELDALRSKHTQGLTAAASDAASLEKAKATAASVGKAKKLEAKMGAAEFVLALQMAHEADVLTSGIAKAAGVTPIYPLPRVIATRTTSDRQADKVRSSLSIDLRLDTVRGVPFEGAPQKLGALFASGRGIGQSALEGEVLALHMGQEPVTTARVMAAADQAKVEMLSLSTANADDVAKVGGLPKPDQARIKRAIAAGHDVVIPSGGVRLDGALRHGWWQVSRQTGEVIGVMSGGEHQAMIEKTLNTQKIGLNDNLAYVFGAFTGALGVHGLVVAEILKNHYVSKEAKKRIKSKLLTWACAVCPSINMSLTFDVTFSGDCFGFSKAGSVGDITAGLGVAAGVSWCKGYGKGFRCAVGVFLDGLAEAVTVELDEDESGWNGHWEHPLNCDEQNAPKP